MQEELPIDALGAALPPEFDDLRPDVVRLLAVRQARRPSEKTCATYERAYARMQRRRVSLKVMGARSRRSFQLYRAALVYMMLAGLESACRLACTGNGDTSTIREQVIGLLGGLNRYPPDGSGTSAWKRPSAGVARKGKRNGMSRIPEGGLARLVTAFAHDPVYADPLRVLFLTGARPCELVKGVKAQITPAGRLRFTIEGGKVTARTGQPVRMIEVPIDNEVAQALVDRAAAGVLVVRITDARKLSDKVRSMSRRLFPKIAYMISPYTFRHAIAAREKAHGRSVTSLAKVLGHVSGRSQRGYGTPQQGRHLGGSIYAVGAQRQVRNTDLSRGYEPAVVNAEGPALGQPSGPEVSAAAEVPPHGPAP
jgi:integrase